jgi:hypothetical protein
MLPSKTFKTFRLFTTLGLEYEERNTANTLPKFKDEMASTFSFEDVQRGCNTPVGYEVYGC